MGSEKMKVAWLAPYRVGLLVPELKIARTSRGEHAASWVVNLASALADRDDIDLHVVVATAGIRENQTVRKQGITFHVIRHTFPFTVRGFPEYCRLDVMMRYAALRRQIRKVVSEVNPDLIHVHGTEHGYGLASLGMNIPVILSIQGVIGLIATVSPSIWLKVQASIERKVIRQVKYFASRTEWANCFVRNLNSRAIIYDAPEAINEAFFKTPEGQSRKNILIVGSVIQRKGIEEAIDAMRIIVAAFPSCRLLVIGRAEPQFLERLKERARTVGVERNVEWLGFKETEELAVLYAASAILIHPSYIDNSPNSVAEAMASGLAIVASDVGGIPSMIGNNITGILVKPRDHRQLARAAIALLGREAERERLGSNAKVVALERHLPAKVAAKMTSIYGDIIRREAASKKQTA
jgi:glycosyltransferase involved in cell wall biosynthesis